MLFRNLLAVAAFMPMSVLAGQHYWLGQLIDNASIHRAPESLQIEMAKTEQADLLECQREHGYSQEEMASYFAAVPIRLGMKGKQTFLVFPSRVCSAFFGAHAVTFWVVSQNRDRSFSKLLTARQDGVEVLQPTKNGLHDLRTHYNGETQIYRFNESVYRTDK